MSLPDPITRIEKYMAKAAGMDVDTPEPITRREQYWDAIANGYTPPEPTGEETTVTGVSPLLLADALAKPMVSLTQYGKCTQASTPAPSNPVPIVCNNGEIKWDSVNERIYADGTPETITLGAQTASAESLFAVGDYADEQEIISGAVTRKCGVLVLDGTESWSAGSAGSGYRKMSLTIPDMMPEGGAEVSGFCTHYKWEYANTVGNFYFASTGAVLQIVEESSKSLSAFKAWLAEQYAAGTPVIVLYPLAEPTTESVTPQPLETAEGDNTITVTANVSGMNLSATYMMKGA